MAGYAGPDSAPYSTRLPRDASTPRRARNWLARKLAAIVPGDRTDRSSDVISCVNELVTDAVQDCESGVAIRLSVNAGTLHVDVIDDAPASGGAHHDRDEALRERILEALADRRGVAPSTAGRASWVEFDLSE